MTTQKLPKIPEWRKPHYLKPNRARSLPRHILVFDTETYPEQIDPNTEAHKLRLGWAVYLDRLKGVEKWRQFRTPNEFYAFLDEVLHNKMKLYVFAHNLDFDAQVIGLFHWITQDPHNNLKRFIVDNKVFIVTITREVEKLGQNVRATLEFLSTTNYAKTSLEQIGRAVGLEKLHVDFRNVDDETLSAYCRRDVEILKRFVLQYLHFVREHDLGRFQPTISSQAFTAFRHRFMHHKILIHNNAEALELERLSYRGGRTEAWRLGDLSHLGTIYKLDVNSMYPYVMKRYEYPTRFLRMLYNVHPNYLFDILSRYLVVGEFTIQVNKPVVGVKRDKLVFPIGTFKAYLTTPEIGLAARHGRILKIHRLAIYESAPIFKSYVNYFYNIKNKYKQEGNKVYYMMTKLFLNSLYGKFGQASENLKLVGEVDSQEPAIHYFYNIDEGRWEYHLYLAGKHYMKDGRVEYRDSFPAIASHITAYARCYLWDLIETAGEENVVYMDTDSLFVTRAGLEKLKHLLDDYELGKLKVEGKCDRVRIWGPKDYEFCEEKKQKGIRKDAVRVGERRYRQAQFVHTRTNLRNYRLPHALVRHVEKELKRTYDKRILLSDGSTRPIVLHEDP